QKQCHRHPYAERELPVSPPTPAHACPFREEELGTECQRRVMAMRAGRPEATEKICLSFRRGVSNHLGKSALGAKKFHLQLLVAHEDQRERRQDEQAELKPSLSPHPKRLPFRHPANFSASMPLQSIAIPACSSRMPRPA